MLTENETQNKSTIKFQHLVESIKNNFIKIIFFAIFGGILGMLLASLFVTPKYESSVDILVNQKTSDSQAQYNLQQADLQAINTYKDVLKKPLILEPTLKALRKKDNFSGSMESIQKDISVGNQNGSQVINVTARNENPYIASDIANVVTKVFTHKIKKIMKVDNVTIVSKATPNLSPVSPNKMLYTLAGFLVGILIELLIIFFKLLNDTTVNELEFLTDELGLINLGTVFHIKDDEENYNVVSVKDKENSSLNDSRKRRV